MQRRITEKGSSVLSAVAQPGANNTGLARYITEETYNAAVAHPGPLMDPRQGALSSLHAATDPLVTGGGFYQPDQDNGLRGYPVAAQFAMIALNEPIKKLSELAEKTTGSVFPG